MEPYFAYGHAYQISSSNISSFSRLKIFKSLLNFGEATNLSIPLAALIPEKLFLVKRRIEEYADRKNHQKLLSNAAPSSKTGPQIRVAPKNRGF